METQRLQKACALLRRRMQEELSAGQPRLGLGEGVSRAGCRNSMDAASPPCCVAPVDWMQEYQCLLILEGLQTMAQQYLHKVQELCTGKASSIYHLYQCLDQNMAH